jgi:hypothetical protein
MAGPVTPYVFIVAKMLSQNKTICLNGVFNNFSFYAVVSPESTVINEVVCK